jgi:predicted HicB family RNase H-like nuclease
MKRVPVVKAGKDEKRFLEGRGKGFAWDEGDERIIKAFNLRLPEPLHMKLQFIAEHTPHSIHSFVMAAVEDAVEREIDNLIN